MTLLPITKTSGKELEQDSDLLQNRVCGLCGNFDSNEMNDLQISDSAGQQRVFGFNFFVRTVKSARLNYAKTHSQCLPGPWFLATVGKPPHLPALM